MYIKSAGFDVVHDRGSITHRLQSDSEKWQPLGIETDDINRSDIN